MRKGIIFVSFFIFHFSLLSAQTDTIPKTNGYFSAGFGMALPVGSFASAAGTNPGHYAGTGISYFISAGVVINKLHFGFAIKEGWYNSRFNATDYLNGLAANDTLTGRTYARAGGDNSYTGGYGMIGLISDIHIHNLCLEFELLGGRLTTVFPEIIYTVSSGGGPTSAPYDFSATQLRAFSLEGGINARLPFAKHFAAKADFDFIYSDVIYSTTETFTNSLGSPVVYYITYASPVSLLSGTIGVAYVF